MDKLIQSAKAYQKRAYAPFSHFHVGSAVLTNDDTIIGGCNVESHVYGLTICAERNAIFSAIAQGYTSFKALAIATNSQTSPCGACRQIIVEICGNVPIYLYSNNDIIETVQSYDLLPGYFTLNDVPTKIQKQHYETTI